MDDDAGRVSKRVCAWCERAVTYSEDLCPDCLRLNLLSHVLPTAFNERHAGRLQQLPGDIRDKFRMAQLHLIDALTALARYEDIAQDLQESGIRDIPVDVDITARQGDYQLNNWAAYLLNAIFGTLWKGSVTSTGSTPSRHRIYPKPLAELRYELGCSSRWCCVYCQRSGTPAAGPDGRNWHVDHIFAHSNGGDFCSDNFVLACATCNLQKHNRLISGILTRVHALLNSEPSNVQ